MAPAPQTLQTARSHYTRHRRGKPRPHESENKKHDPHTKSPGRAVKIRTSTGRHDPHEICQHEDAENPPVEIQSANLRHRRRKDRRHRQGLEGGKRNRKQKTNGEASLLRAPDPPLLGIARLRVAPRHKTFL